MSHGGVDSFLLDLIEEDPEAAAHFADKLEDLDRPDDAEWPSWCGFIRTAWDDLRDDRHVGDMGGIGRIYYTAIDSYAQRAGLVGCDFDLLLLGLRALDEEFIRYVEERRKADRERREKQNQ